MYSIKLRPSEYLKIAFKRDRKTKRAISVHLKVEYPVLMAILNETVIPSREIAKQIQIDTNGFVSFNHWLAYEPEIEFEVTEGELIHLFFDRYNVLRKDYAVLIGVSERFFCEAIAKKIVPQSLKPVLSIAERFLNCKKTEAICKI